MNFLLNVLAPLTGYFNLNNIEVSWSSSWVLKLVSVIIEYFSVWGGLGVGIIIFTLILKIVPLPLDIYSRVSNKRNALRMEKMRPELEKLQKQYANNKQLYTQKMMALQKKNGYSAFSSCLPTLITLIFFIVVINAFSSYSSYKKVETFNEMAVSYTQTLYDEGIENTKEIVITYAEDGATVKSIKAGDNSYTVDEFFSNLESLIANGYIKNLTFNGSNKLTFNKVGANALMIYNLYVKPNQIIYTGENVTSVKFTENTLSESEYNSKVSSGYFTNGTPFYLNGYVTEVVGENLLTSEQVNSLLSSTYFASGYNIVKDGFLVETFLGINGFNAYNLLELVESGYFTEMNVYKTSDDNLKSFYVYTDNIVEEVANQLKTKSRDSAAKRYFELKEQNKFLWVQNIWIEDSPFKKALISEETYKGIFTYKKGTKTKKIESDIVDAYSELTGSTLLDDEKEAPNGYLILVILSIGAMLVSQLVMNKSQKAQLELQSVDGANGQAAQTTKLMTWMMPIMFGIFSFVYTASFSIYMIVSTVFSTISTVIINKIVEKSFNKKLIKEEEEKFNKRYATINKNGNNK